jgi:aminocarboxymuconate-semialdehyde decarboxylase
VNGEPLRAPMIAGMDAVEPRLKAMDEQGVAGQLLSPWIGLVNYAVGESDGVWIAEAINEAISDVVSAHPDRFLGIGSVPLQAPERAAAMLKTLMEEQGLVGVEINTKLSPDRFLDDRSLDPFWAEAESRGAFIMIHPSMGGLGKAFEPYYLRNLISNPLETTLAGAHLIFGGVMERFPKLRICLVHGGGFLPYNLGRLRHGYEVRKEPRVSFEGNVEENFRRFYYDTVTHSVSALDFLVKEVGVDHVLLGSDYPFDMADPRLVETVRKVGLAAESETAILEGNLRRLFLGRD